MGIQGDWQPPGAGRFVSELWDGDGDMERVFMGLGRRGDFLGTDVSLDLPGVGLLARVWSELYSTGRKAEER